MVCNVTVVGPRTVPAPFPTPTFTFDPATAGLTTVTFTSTRSRSWLMCSNDTCCVVVFPVPGSVLTTESPMVTSSMGLTVPSAITTFVAGSKLCGAGQPDPVEVSASRSLGCFGPAPGPVPGSGAAFGARTPLIPPPTPPATDTTSDRTGLRTLDITADAATCVTQSYPHDLVSCAPGHLTARGRVRAGQAIRVNSEPSNQYGHATLARSPTCAPYGDLLTFGYYDVSGGQGFAPGVSTLRQRNG